MEYTTIPLWQPKNNDDPDYEDNDLIKFPTNSKSDKVRLFLFENDVKKAVRKYVKENYNLEISDIDFRKASDNIFVECTVEENE